MRRLLPVLTLVLLAPIVAELLGGAVPITKAYFLLFLVPIYGGGTLLIRELVRRRSRGWASILLLGAAYGLVEEGLALQSLFNPDIYSGLAGWGGRAFGINGVYAELNIAVHAIWSVAIPILLTELLFPKDRNEPYLGRRGLVVSGLVYLIGVALVLGSTQTSLAPGYVAPLGLLGLTALAVIALGIVALTVRQRTPAQTWRRMDAPAPRVVMLVTGMGAFAFIGFLLFPLKAHLGFMQGPLVLLPMVGASVIGGLVAVLINRWSASRDWNDRHRLALATGALVAHTLAGDLAFAKDGVDVAGRVVVASAMIGLLLLASARVDKRVKIASMRQAGAAFSPAIGSATPANFV